MFISASESLRRIETGRALRSRLGTGDNLLSGGEVRVPVSISLPLEKEGSEILMPEEEEKSQPTHPLDFDRMTPTQAEQALEKLLNPSPNGYKGRGTKALHRDTQAAIGVTASILGTTKAARMNDVSIVGAHSYERGYTGPNDLINPAKGPKEELREKILQGHGLIVNKCFVKLEKTLDLLDDEKLEKLTRPIDITIVAKNLSGIIAHATQATQDKNVEVNDNNVHFHIMRPEQAIEAEYKTVEINSAPPSDSPPE